jgi:SAM-dependent methyltransferase
MHALSFLAPLGEIADWRLVLAYDAAVGAGVFDALPASLAELATSLDLEPSSLRAVLDQLAVAHIVTNDDLGRFAPGPAAPSWPVDAMLVRHAAIIRRWADLLPARLRQRDGCDHIEPAAQDPHVGLALLAIHQANQVPTVIDRCLERFPHARRALDVGGGHGAHARELARRGVSTVLQDLPPVIDTLRTRGTLDGADVELVAGDARTTTPDGPFDLVLCSALTNMFDDATNQDLLRRLHAATADHGGIAIATYLRDRTPVAASFALQMLVWTDGGDAHNTDQHLRWLATAGYREPHAEDLQDPPQTLILAER